MKQEFRNDEAASIVRHSSNGLPSEVMLDEYLFHGHAFIIRICEKDFPSM